MRLAGGGGGRRMLHLDAVVCAVGFGPDPRPSPL
jgi:hypothetical protein